MIWKLSEFKHDLRLLQMAFLLMAVAVANHSSAVVAGETTPIVAAPEPQVRIPLGKVDVDGPDSIRLMYSQNGQTICAWSESSRVTKAEGRYTRVPPEFKMFDLTGKELGSHTNQDYSLLLTNFPSLAWRLRLEPFRTNAESWFFSPEHSVGIRVFKLSTLWDLRIECWMSPQTSSNSLLWVRQMQREFGCKPIAMTESSEAGVLFVTGAGQELMVLSKETGQTLRRFTVGHIETDKEAGRRKRKFGMPFDNGDPALYFSSHVFSYDEKDHLLACGAFYDKRVRVLDITPPVKVVFEANTDANPAQPPGGSWVVRRVEFAADGRYLVVRYDFGGKLTKVSIDSTEIFDVRSWKSVWKENNPSIGSVALSPNGRLLAFVQDNSIHVIPFRPTNR